MPEPLESSEPAALRLRRALVRHSSSQGRRWLEFRDPVAQFVATDLEDVGPVIESVEATAKNGYWLVGCISYDAAPAFDDALVAHHDPTVPLVAFAAFEEPHPSRGPAGRAFHTEAWVPSCDQQDHEAAVRSIHELIAAGNTYQVNYTLRLHSDFSGDPEGLFAAMCRAQRADHLAFLDFGNAAVCSASPEQLISRDRKSVV